MAAPFPPRPALVFRIGFAGNRLLLENEDQLPTAKREAQLEPLRRKLDEVVATIARYLEELRRDEKRRPLVAYYSKQAPRLRLVTGLADGGDYEAALALGRLAAVEHHTLTGNRPTTAADVSAADALRALTPTAGGEPAPRLHTELAAVLGCDQDAYCTSQEDSLRQRLDQLRGLPPANLTALLGTQPLDAHIDARVAECTASFNALLPHCSYVLALDGKYVAGPGGHHHRARLYRAQATFLLRHVDVLLAVADPAKPARPGGTLETVQRALSFGLPVIFVVPATGQVVVLEPGGEDLATLLEQADRAPEATAGATTWQTRIGRLVETVIAGPTVPTEVPKPDDGARPNTSAAAGRKKPPHGLTAEDDHILSEYFADKVPPNWYDDVARKTTREKSPLEWCWERFDWCFKEPIGARLRHVWRQLMTPWLLPPKMPKPDFTTAYNAYRDRATELNYHYSGHYRGAFVLNYALAVLTVVAAALSLTLQAHGWHPTGALVGLGLFKLTLLVQIVRISRRAHHENWNDRAVDYRYLAERLRALRFLPRLGSFQPPSPAPPQYANRVVRQSAVDWLFKAIVRSVPPPVAMGATLAARPVKLQPAAVPDGLHLLETGVLDEQIAYHHTTERKLTAMNRVLEWAGTSFSWIIIGCVAVDLLFLLKWVPEVLPPHSEEARHHLGLWLVFVATFLPAAVASLNGIRFQSEAHRLAERSKFVHGLLHGRKREVEKLRAQYTLDTATQNNPDNLGSWQAQVLRRGEAVANDLVEEVAEWSVIYAKDFLEPG